LVDGLQKQSASKEHKTLREKERYAATSREKKDEKIRAQRERRMMKDPADDNQLGQVHVPMEQDGNNECLQNGQLTEHNQQTGSSYRFFNVTRV
jgi:type IV secretory pathway VirJ component